MLNFDFFNEAISKNIQVDVADESSIALIASIMINQFDIAEIDFSKLDEDDILNMRDNLFEIITTEDDDGDIKLDPGHPYSQVYALQHKITGMESAPKIRVQSSFRFL